MTHESWPIHDTKPLSVHRTRTWPWFLASAWLMVLVLTPWVVLYTARIWYRGHAPVLDVVPSGGFSGGLPLPGVMGHVLPVASMLSFLTLLALPFPALMTFGLGLASIGSRSPRARTASASLATSLLAVVLFPWAIVILGSGGAPTPPSATTETLTLVVLLAVAASVPLVGHWMVGPLAYRPAQALPGAGWYADPATVAGLRWWDGTRWTDACR